MMEFQTTLFGGKVPNKRLATKWFENSEWGTFKDSLRSPIHNWFPYPAGFSNKAVEYAIEKFHINKNDVIYDPFSGIATTNIVAKSLGIKSVGIEAHPFIYFIGKTKTQWDYDETKIIDNLQKIQNTSKHFTTINKNEFPPLVYNCFSEKVLKDLYSIRESIKINNLDNIYANFFNLALACILRPVSNVATGWPYIGPKKKKNGREKDVFKTYSVMVSKMFRDIKSLTNTNSDNTFCEIIKADARDTKQYIKDKSIDLIFTSPPYLNNYDYSDRTRLEMYFFGWARNWGEITEKVRTQLIMSATTQINRGKYHVGDIISNDLKKCSPEISKALQAKINQLSKIRVTKGGKKSYDILIGGYFNDMFLVLRDCFRVLKNGKKFILILGDSAPYGVHIPTEIVLGTLALSIGFSDYKIEILRKRGDKWKHNPQRHKTELREAILYLTK